MTTKQPLIFTLSLTHNGTTIQTKAVKCAYAGYETMYKVALPSVLDSAPVCWLVKDGETWKFGLDVTMDAGLKSQLINAIAGHDETKSIVPYAERSLKSA